MFDFLTGTVLFLSCIYEGYRLVYAINALVEYSQTIGSIDTDTTAFLQMESVKNNSIFEIVICGVLLLLTLICLLRFIRWAIIGNIIYMTHNTTKDFIKTTNGDGSGSSVKVKSKSSAYGGMKITNSGTKKEKQE